MTTSLKNTLLEKLKVNKKSKSGGTNPPLSPLSIHGNNPHSQQENRVPGLTELPLNLDIASPTSEPFQDSPSFPCGILTLLEDEEDTSPQVPSTSSHVPDNDRPGTRPSPCQAEASSLHPNEEYRPGPQSLEGDLGNSGLNSCFLKRKSRLSKSFAEVLKDPGALGYFIQFMDSRHLGHLVKFYLAAESFRVSASAIFSKKEFQCQETERKCDIFASHNLCNSNQRIDGSSDATGFHCDESNKNSAKISQNSESCDATDSGISVGIKEMTERDAVRIFAKYIGKDASSSVGVTESIRNSVINKICCENGCLDPECFWPAQEFVKTILEDRYFPDFIGSVYYCKHQVDVVTSGSVTLADILFNESALSYFTEFVECEGAGAWVGFWLAADSFRQDLIRRQGIYSSTEAQNDAMVLYDKYFSMQGSEPLNLGEGVRIGVENSICREGGPLPDCFDVPAKIVYANLEQVFLPRFLQSSLFVKYLSELIHTIRNTIELPDPNRPRGRLGSTTGSDVSSGDMSVGSSASVGARIRNTLLAQESPQAAARRRQASHVSSDQISLDSALYAPQDLYDRPSSNPPKRRLQEWNPNPKRESTEEVQNPREGKREEGRNPGRRRGRSRRRR